MRIYSRIKFWVNTVFLCIIVILLMAAFPAERGMVKCKQDKIANNFFNAIPLNQLSISANTVQRQIPGYYRPLENTYLTFAEWYIVYSAQEYAEFLKQDTASNFPYFSAITQYWYGYCAAYQLTKKHYAFNWGDHLMLIVIGISFSAQYTVDELYENTLGRLSLWTSAGAKVPEDDYSQKVAQAYADFVPVRPWYEFSYAKSLYGLWYATSLTGPYMFRKWERKMSLSIGYLVEAVYSQLIELGTHLVYGNEDDYTYALIKADKQIFTDKMIKKIAKLFDQEYIVRFPRYQPFTTVVSQLAGKDSAFIDIAGNQQILVTVIAPNDWSYNLPMGKVLFRMKILTQPQLQRLAVELPVSNLINIMQRLQEMHIKIEHIYDY